MRDLGVFIGDWHWDERSYEFAQQAGAFLLQFLDHLKASGLSQRRLQEYINNCQFIGFLAGNYGYYDTFSPAVLLNGPHFLVEFEHKASRSKWAIASYKATWRRLDRYVRSLGFGERDRQPRRTDDD